MLFNPVQPEKGLAFRPGDGGAIVRGA